jgi:ABC-type Fe3+ transport system substrate-binding protein
MVVNGAPHPNAVKVYLDWVLGYEAQLAHSKAIDHTSLRTDVPFDFIHPALVPQEGGKYVDYDYKEAYQVKKGTEITDFVTREIAKLGK